MISFRYHLVTIVALFLALALGVLAGTTVIRSGLVAQLRRNTAQAEQQRDQVQRQLDQLSGFQSASLPWLTTHRLRGQSALVITADDADPAGARNAQAVLEQAGADTVSLIVTKLVSGPTPQTQNALADILGESRDTPAQTLTSDAATRLAERLAEGPSPQPPPTEGGASEDDLLVALLKGGFIRSPDVTPSDASTVGGSDELMVVSAGGEQDPSVPIDTVMQRLVEQMAVRGETVAAVQTAGTRAHPFVTGIREDGDLGNDHLMTVDDVDAPEGRAALVLGLSRMLDGGTGGDYGTGNDAQAILPEVP